ncbi:hypothetical protein AVEN_20046-1 [Araneus ventricosus]|uniref:Tc3 transposase DNA binding domain-containing protein n=1 Tax=Araneus ventricosus TaxID=182803 RepID=A0A4Y1ZL58_ARAVE|nr:hypothetical protein AVEN_20046-1 [Araneus ventricosus]
MYGSNTTAPLRTRNQVSNNTFGTHSSNKSSGMVVANIHQTASVCNPSTNIAGTSKPYYGCLCQRVTCHVVERSEESSYDDASKIGCMRAKQKSVSEIADAFKRSERGIYQILAHSEGFKRKSRSGKPRVTSWSNDRRVGNLASTGNYFPSRIKNIIGGQISKKTIH